MNEMTNSFFLNLEVGDYVVYKSHYLRYNREREAGYQMVPLEVLAKTYRRSNWGVPKPYVKVYNPYLDDIRYFPATALKMASSSMARNCPPSKIWYWEEIMRELKAQEQEDPWEEFMPPPVKVTYKPRRSSEELQEDNLLESWHKIILKAAEN